LREKLRRKSAAVISSTSDVAVCNTTSPLRMVNRRPGRAPAFSFLSVSMTPDASPEAPARAEQHAGHDRRGEDERQHAQVHAHVETDRQRNGRSACSSARNPTLDSTTPSTPPAIATMSDSTSSCLRGRAGSRNREPNGDLAPSVARLREQETGQVRARDDQHEPHDDISAVAAGTTTLSTSGLTAICDSGMTRNDSGPHCRDAPTHVRTNRSTIARAPATVCPSASRTFAKYEWLPVARARRASWLELVDHLDGA